MINEENGRADLIQRIAEGAFAEAEKAPLGERFWNDDALEEAHSILELGLSSALIAEVSGLSVDEREAVASAMVPLIVAEYESQRSVIENLAVHAAEDYSVADLREFIRDENLSAPECYSFECALKIRELAEGYSLDILEALSRSANSGEAYLYQDAMIVRRAIYAKRRELMGRNREHASFIA